MTGRKIFRLFVLVVWGAVIQSDSSSAWPGRPRSIIQQGDHADHPYAPGGGLDISYQPIVDILPEYLGQKLIVSHKPGAAERSHGFCRKAKPDGTPVHGGSSRGSDPGTRKVLIPTMILSLGNF